MRALVFTDLDTVVVQDVPGAAAGPGNVIIEVERAGICGSELHGISTPGSGFPRSSWATSSSASRRTAAPWRSSPSCRAGDCDLCRAGQPQICRSRALLGVHRAGGFAQRVAVPAANLHEIPPGLDWDRAALVEPVANAVHAWRLAGERARGPAGVIGLGPIGLACVEVARHLGSQAVDGADLSAPRRDVAAALGADQVGEALTREYDVVIDAVGTAGTRAASVERLIPGGVAVWLGLASPDSGFDATNAVRFEKTVRGSFAYHDEEFAEALAIAPGLDLSWSTTFPLDQGATVFTSHNAPGHHADQGAAGPQEDAASASAGTRRFLWVPRPSTESSTTSPARRNSTSSCLIEDSRRVYPC